MDLLRFCCQILSLVGVGARVYDIKERKGEASLRAPTHLSLPRAGAGPGHRGCPQVRVCHLFGQMRSGAERRLAGAAEMAGIVGWIAGMVLLRHPEDV